MDRDYTAEELNELSRKDLILIITSLQEQVHQMTTTKFLAFFERFRGIGSAFKADTGPVAYESSFEPSEKMVAEPIVYDSKKD